MLKTTHNALASGLIKEPRVAQYEHSLNLGFWVVLPPMPQVHCVFKG